MRGEVAGINAAIMSGNTGGNIGIGFAVPINVAKGVLPQLEKGKVVRGRIGVQVRSTPLAQDEAKALGLPNAAGAIVSSVERGGPADRAGLQPGDVVVEFNGKPIATADALVSLVSMTPPGTRATMRVYRDGKEQTLTITVEELTGTETAAARGQGSRQFGLSLGDVTPSAARQLQLPAGRDGAVVEQVDQGSAAEQAGVQVGDVILEINRRAAHNANEATQALAGVEAGRPLSLLLWRQGAELFLLMRRE